MKTDGRGLKLLIIDEAEDTREVMSQLFRKKGFNVEAVASSKEAFEIIPQHKPELIIFNITMSEIDAFVTGKQLRENPETQNIPIIFLSASKDLSEVIFKLAGAKLEYLEKPCSISYLIKQANRLVAFSKQSPPATE